MRRANAVISADFPMPDRPRTSASDGPPACAPCAAASSRASSASRPNRRSSERTQGIDHFVASVAPDNETSLAIIRKLGFVRTGEHIDREDGLEYVFQLRD